MRVTVDFYEGKPIGVTLPKTVDLRVTDTAPGLKSATVTNALKPATTETGLVVPVPNFVDVDDVIRVDTESRQLRVARQSRVSALDFPHSATEERFRIESRRNPHTRFERMLAWNRARHDGWIPGSGRACTRRDR